MTEHRKRIMAKREAMHAAGPGRVTFVGSGKARRLVFEPRRKRAADWFPFYRAPSQPALPHQGDRECARRVRHGLANG